MNIIIGIMSLYQTCFPSCTGDAAGFQKHCSRFRVDIPDNIIPTDVNINRLDPSIDCVVFVAAKNNVGDPVINEIRKIRRTYPNLCGLLINCDLSDKVLSGGMKGKAERDSFRTSISPAFYFRNIVSISRPSMVSMIPLPLLLSSYYNYSCNYFYFYHFHTQYYLNYARSSISRPLNIAEFITVHHYMLCFARLGSTVFYA